MGTYSNTWKKKLREKLIGTDKALGRVGGEGDVRGRRAVSLVVRDDFDAVIFPDTHATVGGPQIDPDRVFGDCFGHLSFR